MTISIQTIIDTSYTYQVTDSGTCILRSNNGDEMNDTLLILPRGTDLIIKNTDNLGSGLILTCADNALIDGQQNSIAFSGLGIIHLISDGNNWWII